MSRYEPGMRVGAILSADAETVHLLGYGVYDGDMPAPFGPLGMTTDEYLEGGRLTLGHDPPPFKNPRITLDDGRVVWGCQCWWGPEAEVQASIGDRKVIPAETES